MGRKLGRRRAQGPSGSAPVRGEQTPGGGSKRAAVPLDEQEQRLQTAERLDLRRERLRRVGSGYRSDAITDAQAGADAARRVDGLRQLALARLDVVLADRVHHLFGDAPGVRDVDPPLGVAETEQLDLGSHRGAAGAAAPDHLGVATRILGGHRQPADVVQQTSGERHRLRAGGHRVRVRQQRRRDQVPPHLTDVERRAPQIAEGGVNDRPGNDAQRGVEAHAHDRLARGGYGPRGGGSGGVGRTQYRDRQGRIALDHLGDGPHLDASIEQQRERPRMGDGQGRQVVSRPQRFPGASAPHTIIVARGRLPQRA